MRVTNCDRLSAIYLQRGMHLFAALTRMLPSLIDIARSRISGPGSAPILPSAGETKHLRWSSAHPPISKLLPAGFVDLSGEARGILAKTRPRVKLEHTLANPNIDRTCTRYARGTNE